MLIIWLLFLSPILFSTNKIPEKNVLPLFEVREFKKADEKIFSLEDEISAEGAIVLDDSGKIIYGKNINQNFSLASLTKLLSAYTSLEIYKENQIFSFTSSALEVPGEVGNFKKGEKLTLNELLSASLIASSNDSIYLLAEYYGVQNFVRKINETLNIWGFKNTKIYEPTGISLENSSTPYEFSQILLKLYLKRPEIFEISRKEYVDINGRRLWTTNILLRKYSKIIVGGKTGYLPEFGENLALIIKFPESPFLSLVLFKSQDRFKDAEILIKSLAKYYRYEL
jgi:D-alanyl-D-alanine carboxypeptidase